jgi:hypothetical protein
MLLSLPRAAASFVEGSGYLVGKKPAFDPESALGSCNGVNFHPGVGGISSSGFGSGYSKSSETVGEKQLWFMRYFIFPRKSEHPSTRSPFMEESTEKRQAKKRFIILIARRQSFLPPL